MHEDILKQWNSAMKKYISEGEGGEVVNTYSLLTRRKNYKKI